MNVTEDVIRDLHVLVQAGEASADTRALVEAWLADHPALAEELRRPHAWSPPAVAPALSAGAEYRALRRTKALLARRSWSMAMGFLFTGLPLSFAWDATGLHLLLVPAHTGLALLSLALAMAAWVVFVRTSRALNPAGF